jgi:hypothetical protein
MGPEDPAAVAAALRRGMEELNTLSTERAGGFWFELVRLVGTLMLLLLAAEDDT